MGSVGIFLMTIAGIFLIGAAGEAIFRRTQIPDVLWLIVVGIAVGPLFHVVTREQLTRIAPYFAALTLVIVLFEGGSKLKLQDLSKSAPRSALLAILTFALATAVVSALSMGAHAVGWLPAEWSWSHGFMLGAILGGSSSIIIMPAMDQAKVEAPVANLVGLESAFTDAFCVVGASAAVDVLTKGTAAGQSPAGALFQSFGIGGAIGVTSGATWLLVLRFLKGSVHAYPITLSALLVLYVMIDKAGGSAALGILAFAVVVGNAGLISSKVGLVGELDLGGDVRGFHSQMTFIIKSFFFTFIGAMLGPPWSLIALGVVIGFMLFFARVPGVLAATLGSGLTLGQKKLVAVSLPRGMAAGVLATLPAAAGVSASEGLPPLVFAATLTTILIFAAGFPLARRGQPPTSPVAAGVGAEPGVAGATGAQAGGMAEPGPVPTLPSAGAGPPANVRVERQDSTVLLPPTKEPGGEPGGGEPGGNLPPA